MKTLFGIPRWGFLINPSDNLFQGFAEFARSPDFAIWRREPGLVSIEHVFASAHFEWASHVQEVSNRAVALKAVFDGAMYLEYGERYIAPVFRRLIDNHSQQTHDFPPGNVLANPYAPTTVRSAVPREFDPVSRETPAHLVFLARYDDVARAMLKHLGFNGPDYRTLFSLLDWLTHHGWKDPARIAAPSGMKASEVRRFTATVNNVEVLGPHARHGDKNYAPPSQPMTLREARQLILPATRAFLFERSAAIDLVGRWRGLRAE
jgi:hypothetical protein